MPMPYALCPMPYALCPMPARASHVTEKGYSYFCILIEFSIFEFGRFPTLPEGTRKRDSNAGADFFFTSQWVWDEFGSRESQ